MKRGVLIGLCVLGLVLVNAAFVEWTVSRGSNSQFPFRPASGWFWLQGYGAWLDKDEERLRDYYSFATALDPTNLHYWRLAAQTLAFDVPTWDTGRTRPAHGREALSFFERSRSYFTNSSEWFQTGAFLAEVVVEDQVLALQYLEEGVADKSHSFLVGKRYVRLLWERGDLDKALDFLKSWLPSLEGGEFPERHQEMSQWKLSLEKELDANHAE